MRLAGAIGVMGSFGSITRAMGLYGLVSLLSLICIGSASAQPESQAFVSDLELRIDSIGPGRVSRAGAWTGVRVTLNELSTGPREVILRLSEEDSDGDTAAFERAVTTTPATEQSFWVYAPLPLDAVRLDRLRVRAHEALPDGRAGRVLASAEETFRPAVSWDKAMGVLGSRHMELRQYQNQVGASGSGQSPLWHQVTEVVTGLGVEDLPDRWQGLDVFEVLVWAGPSAPSDADPQDLADAPEKAEAIREWVERGGHLVVVLPGVGQAWESGLSNPLVPLLPRVVPTRAREGVDFAEFGALLGKDRRAVMPRGQTYRVLPPAPDAGPGEAIPILSTPGGEPIVVRRLVGSGAVTLIGLDLMTRGMADLELPEPEAFWHRVLGRRGRFWDAEEMLAVFENRANQVGAGRERALLDSDIADAPDGGINRTGRAAQGLLLAVVVFAAYWVVAGPGGFAVLKRRGQSHHAWVGFVAAGGVFTGLAWSGAYALKPKEADARSLALIEQVHGQATQRVRMWSSVLVPRYGTAELSVGEEGAGGVGGGGGVVGARYHNLIAPWKAAETRSGSFPDNRVYTLDSRRPDRAQIPVRATVKQVRVDWAGPQRAEWGMPRPVGEVGDSAQERVIRVAGDGRLSGLVAHELPGALRDVMVVWTTGQTSLNGERGVLATSTVYGVSLEAGREWKPGERLDLGELMPVDRPMATLSFSSRLRAIAAQGIPVAGVLGGPTISRVVGSFRERLISAGFLDQADSPPDAARNLSGEGQAVGLSSLHGWGLGRWMTQPCVMVLGFLEADGGSGGGGGGGGGLPAAAPLRLDGEAIGNEGLTLVRWIYPLEGSPPGYAGAEAGPDIGTLLEGAGGGSGGGSGGR